MGQRQWKLCLLMAEVKALEVAMLVQNTNKETKGVLMYCGKSPQSHGSIYRVHIGGSGRVLPHTKPTIHLYLS
jgi:hypothetical protein